MIEVQGLRPTFGRTVALDGLDMAVETGKVMGLLGRNGAGKTTLVRILSTLDRPDQGRAMVGGYDVKADRFVSGVRSVSPGSTRRWTRPSPVGRTSRW